MKRSGPELKIFNYLTKLKAVFTTDFATSTSLMTSNGHGLVDGDCVQLTTATTLPAGLSLLTNYYVKNATTNTFSLSLTPNGTAATFTDDGTGAHSFNLKGKKIECEEFAHEMVSFNTSGSANLTIKFQGSFQDDVNFNVAQSVTNRWDYVQVKDLEDNAAIDGDTGVALSGTDDNRLFEINTNGIKSFTVAVIAWSAGTMEIRTKRFALDNI